jgi:hypothetical protein
VALIRCFAFSSPMIGRAVRAVKTEDLGVKWRMGHNF